MNFVCSFFVSRYERNRLGLSVIRITDNCSWDYRVLSVIMNPVQTYSFDQLTNLDLRSVVPCCLSCPHFPSFVHETFFLPFLILRTV